MRAVPGKQKLCTSRGSPAARRIRSRRLMQRWLVLFLFLAAALMRSEGLAAEALLSRPTPNLTVTVWVYNYAQVPRGLLRKGKSEASRVLDTAGIETVWVDCRTSQRRSPSAYQAGQTNCSGELPGNALVLRILPRSTPASSAFPAPIFGFADSTWLASVLYGRIEDFAEGVDNDETEIPCILGGVIAHELGHLLLGPDSHADTGVMRAEWDRAQVRQALSGRLHFAPLEAKPVQTTEGSRGHVRMTLPSQ